jgi:NitT/TauT family transport system substrate-binding protein
MNKTIQTLCRAAIFTSLALLAGCSEPETDPTLTKVSFNMGWLPQGSMAGVIVAIDKGFYNEVGLEIETARGFGGIRTVNEIDQGMFDFGYGDPLAVLLNLNNGGNTRMVGAINDRWPAGLCYITERNQIDSPADLAGLKVGGGQSSPMQVIVPAWLEINGVDKEEVQMMQLDPSIVVGSLIEGNIDAGECWLGNSLAIFQKRAKDADLTLDYIEYSEFNLDIYGNGIVTSNRLAAEQPQIVRDFLSATYRGYDWVRDHQEEAAAIVVKNYPVLDSAITLQQIEEISDLISGPAGLGWMQPEKVTNTIEFFSTAYGLEENITADQIFSNEFLSASSASGE